jgi:hypothetical protein
VEHVVANDTLVAQPHQRLAHNLDHRRPLRAIAPD